MRLIFYHFTFISAGVIFRPDDWKNANGQKLCTKQLVKKFAGKSLHTSFMRLQNRCPLCSVFVQSKPSTGLAANSSSGLLTLPLIWSQSRTTGIYPNGTCTNKGISIIFSL